MKRKVTVIVERVRRVEIRGSTVPHVPDPAASTTNTEPPRPQTTKGEESMIANIVRTLFTATIVLFASLLSAQQPPLASGLIGPVETAFTHGGNLIVSEAGSGPNTGRISLVDRTNGRRRTLVDGLPSAIFTGTGESQPSGPAGLALAGSTLYVTITNGDSVMAGPAQGTEMPNPNPSSPILSSVLALQGSAALDTTTGGFVLPFSAHARLKNGESVTLSNADGQTLTVRLVVDFPNFSSEPRPDFPGNVRLSNPFGVVAVGQTLYVVDASQNLIRRVDVNSGAFTTLTTFARVQNPTPVGPPMIDAVPNSVRLRGSDLLVTTLTGFPFPSGSAEVRRVDIATGSNEPFVGGLTSGIDIATLGDGSQSPILTLEFSTNMTQGAPGRLRMVQPGGAVTTVAEGLITPTSVLVDRRSGEVFVTLLGPGIIRRIDASAIVPLSAAGAVLPVVGSAQGAFGARFRSSAQLTNPNDFAISGRLVFHPLGRSDGADDRSLGYVLAPHQTLTYEDLAAAAGATGIGSMDVIPAVGPPAVTVVRVVDGASACEPAVQIPQVDRARALSAGTTAALITGATGERFNVGVRALEQGAAVTMTLYDASGTRLTSITHGFGTNQLLQRSASEFLGVAVPANSSIVFRVVSGTAVIYGSAVDNSGKGMTLQLATAD